MKHIQDIYENSSTEIQLKVPMMNVIFIALTFFAVLLLVNLFFVTFTLVRFGGIILLNITTFLSFYIFRKGYYESVSSFYFSFLISIISLLRLYDILGNNTFVFAPNVAILGSLLVIASVFVNSKKVIIALCSLIGVILSIGAAAFIYQGNLEKTPDALSFQIIYPGVAIATIIIGVLLTRSIFDKVLQSALNSLGSLKEKNAEAQFLIQESAVQLQKADSLLSNAQETANASTEISINIENIDNRIEILNSNVLNTDKNLHELSVITEELQTLADDQNSHVTQSNAAIEQMAVSIQNVAKIVEQKEDLITDLNYKAQHGKNQVEETVQAFDKVTDHLATINKMTSVISQIAAQTNLLAMNAAIEAAHAGDAGRGFSVVAAEIRNLASNASNSTKEITGRLKDLIHAIEETGGSVEQSGFAFSGIQAEIEEVSKAMHEIAASTKELSIGSKEVLSSTSSLHDATQIVRDVIERVRKAQNNIVDNEKNVSTISSEITSGIKEISTGIHLISAAVKHIHNLSAELKKHSQDLFRTAQKDQTDQ